MKLELRGETHFLDGKPLARNAELELRIVGGWLRCRYLWNGDPETQPVFAVALGGLHEQLVLEARVPPDAILRVELADAEFRWP